MSAMSLAEALAMLAEAFNEPIENLKPELARESVPGWDSMGALLLIAELDERFGLELTADTSKSMQRIGDVLDYLRQRGVLTE